MHALLDTAQRAPLEPDDFVPNVGHRLTLDGVLHGVETLPLVHGEFRRRLNEGPKFDGAIVSRFGLSRSRGWRAQSEQATKTARSSS